MRVLLVGAGGVGGAIVRIAVRRPFLEAMGVADHDPDRGEAAVAALGCDARFTAAQVDAGDEAAVARLLARHRCDVLLNATDRAAGSSSATSSSRRRPTGRRRVCRPSSAWVWSRVCRASSPGTPPMNSSTRSRRSASATART